MRGCCTVRLLIRSIRAVVIAAAVAHAQPFKPDVPRTWSEEALKVWATPVAGLNLRPTHLSVKEYYALPVRDLATYPVYFPGQEPEGYWESLQKLGPKPLIEPERLKTQADWIEAGRRVFHAATASLTITLDATIIAAARKAETYSGRKPAPDGIVRFLGWLPTKDGVALTLRGACAACHSQVSAPGAPTTAEPAAQPFASAGVLRRRMRNQHILDGGGPFLMGPGPIGIKLFQAYATPWRSDAGSEDWKYVTDVEWGALRAAFARSGAVPRWNGSLHYPAKTPDLIGIRDRKYLDHTATYLHRSIGDLMRYAALVLSAETADFGPHHMIFGGTTRLQSRFSDEALYALALYIYSLRPPPSPHAFDAKAQAGQQIFAREGCANCHTPPLYTSNKLTLAVGFSPPTDRPVTLDVLPVSVGTDSGLALKTRKGTGYYKVPSLKGVWYRGRYLHDGSVATLEEMFNPARLKDTHVPGGFIPAGMKTRAIKGHEFGLKLDEAEKEQLIAFLRTL